MLSYESIQLELNKIFDKDNFSIEEVKKNLKKYNNEFIVIKCGGKVLLDPILLDGMIGDIAILKKLQLVFFRGVKIQFGEIPLKSYIFRHDKN